MADSARVFPSVTVTFNFPLPLELLSGRMIVIACLALIIRFSNNCSSCDGFPLIRAWAGCPVQFDNDIFTETMYADLMDIAHNFIQIHHADMISFFIPTRPIRWLISLAAN